MDKIKGQLAGVAALLGVIAAIGGGFVKYGEITTKLDALESAGGTDWSAQIAVLEEKVSTLENADTSHTHKVSEHKHEEHSHTATLINKKEIELIKNQIEELKLKSGNPLAQ
jgi:hypothetical protein|tara:strand:- start:248 stop:583 length:336 start_codon:yes stop_codon:yes gene_type:complete